MRKLSEYIGSQFGNPRGFIGKICCLIMNIINKTMYNGVVDSLVLNKNMIVLDIGYGNGYMLHKLYKKSGGNIYGIDISEDMKKEASKKNHKAISRSKMHLTIGDCCKLDYADVTFNAITSVNTIYFWEDTLKGLEEIYRVLKVDGVFLNAVYSKEWMERTSYTKKGFKLFTPQEIATLAKRVGFSNIQIKDIGHKNRYIIKCIKSQSET